MITVYAGTDSTVRFSNITDADGAALSLTGPTAVLRIDDVGEYALAAVEAGVGDAVVLGADTSDRNGFGRYQVLIDDEVSEEGICHIRRTVPTVDVVS